MAQFDIHLNPSKSGRDGVPYVVDIQSDLLGRLSTRLTMPLAMPERFPQLGPPSLCPRFHVEGMSLVLLPHLAAAFRARELGPSVGSLSIHASALAAAIDAVFSGY